MREHSRIYSVVRNFLFSSTNKEFLIFLFFLVVSGVFWMMLTLNETYERELSVPVRLAGVPENVVVTDDLEDTVRFVVRDKGFTLLAYAYGDVIHPVTVSFSTYANDATGYGSVPVADVQKSVVRQLYGSSKIVSVKSEKLEFFFNHGLSKRVPVRLSGNIVPGGSYYLARTLFSPETVTVYASQEILDSLQFVTTEDLNIENFADTVRTRVGIKRLRGVKSVPETVTVTLCPDVLTEDAIEVPISVENQPEGKVLRMFPSKVRVRFTAGASQIRSITAEQFVVAVDYKEVAVRPSDKCTLYLRTTPHGVRNVSLETQQVDYLIEQQ